MSDTTSGHLLIADISGYTRYLTSSELEHAQGVLGTLMELLIDRTLPPLKVSGLEGDAVFSYGFDSEALGGQTLVEIVEDTYVAFRRAIDLMVMNTTCECNACANILTLDLKFFVHYGTFTIGSMRGREELVGPAVIAIHRMLKNHVTEQTDVHAYTAYSGQAVDALGLGEFAAGLMRHEESFADVGEITLWVQDMHPVWEGKQDNLRIEIAPDDVLVELDGDLPVPVSVAWELITQPDYRAALLDVHRQSVGGRRAGRVTNGSVFTCYHGKNRVTTQTVVDWHPFEQMTTSDTTPVPGATVLMRLSVRPSDAGTTLTVTCSKARGKLIPRLLCNVASRPLLRSTFRKGLVTVREMIEHGIADGSLHVAAQGDSADHDVRAAVASSLAPAE
jgi:hypothetical protein